MSRPCLSRWEVCDVEAGEMTKTPRLRSSSARQILGSQRELKYIRGVETIPVSLQEKHRISLVTTANVPVVRVRRIFLSIVQGVQSCVVELPALQETFYVQLWHGGRELPGHKIPGNSVGSHGKRDRKRRRLRLQQLLILAAWAFGFRPASSSFARMKKSIGFRGQALSFTLG